MQASREKRGYFPRLGRGRFQPLLERPQGAAYTFPNLGLQVPTVVEFSTRKIDFGTRCLRRQRRIGGPHPESGELTRPAHGRGSNPIPLGCRPDLLSPPTHCTEPVCDCVLKRHHYNGRAADAAGEALGMQSIISSFHAMLTTESG
jgi:hypothetical protein